MEQRTNRYKNYCRDFNCEKWKRLRHIEKETLKGGAKVCLINSIKKNAETIYQAEALKAWHGLAVVDYHH